MTAAAGRLVRRSAVLSALSVLSCSAPRPNVVVYVVDTLRADALGTYGNPVVATPALDRLAAEGMLFENAAAPSSWTRPSMASLLTGQRPDRHGVHGRDHALAPEHVLLPELFREAGYATGAFVANPNIGRFYGFAKGWDDYVELYGRAAPGKVEESELVTRSDQLNERVFEWIDRSRRPFLLLVLSIDPHWPYAAPPGFERAIAERLAGSEAGRVARAPDLLPQYYAEVAFNDRSLGGLLDHLRERRIDDDTIVLFAADHGEEFRDHGGLSHGRSLYEEVLRIPLVLRAPGRVPAGARVSTRIELPDAFPTLLELAGLPVPPGIDGRSLLESQPPQPSFASLQLDGQDKSAVVDYPWKLVIDRDRRRESLFHLAQDPRETEDLIVRHAREAAELRAALWRRSAEPGVRPGSTRPLAELPDADREALESLGYLGSP